MADWQQARALEASERIKVGPSRYNFSLPLPLLDGPSLSRVYLSIFPSLSLKIKIKIRIKIAIYNFSLPPVRFAEYEPSQIFVTISNLSNSCPRYRTPPPNRAYLIWFGFQSESGSSILLFLGFVFVFCAYLLIRKYLS